MAWRCLGLSRAKLVSFLIFYRGSSAVRLTSLSSKVSGAALEMVFLRVWTTVDGSVVICFCSDRGFLLSRN